MNSSFDSLRRIRNVPKHTLRSYREQRRTNDTIQKKSTAVYIHSTWILVLEEQPSKQEIVANENQLQSNFDMSNPQVVPEVRGNDEFGGVRLSPFWKNRPKLWFLQLEYQFIAYGIRSDDVKLGIVLSHLDEETVFNVAGVLEQLPESNKYEHIKTALTQTYCETTKEPCTNLLAEIELGDKPATVLLEEMRALAESNITDDVLRKLWLQKLPERTQEVLVVMQDCIALDILAEFADTLLQTMPQAVENTSYNNADTIKKLTEQVHNLTEFAENTLRASATTSRKDADTIKELTEQVEKFTEFAENTVKACETTSRRDADTIKELTEQVEKLKGEMETLKLTSKSTSRKDAETIQDLLDTTRKWVTYAQQLKELKESTSLKDANTIKYLTEQMQASTSVEAGSKNDERFQQVHLDLIGPLCDCYGYSYCLVMVDHYTRWLEATPIANASADTVARAFFGTWVSRFGSPKIITTDQTSQFESKLFAKLTRLLGCKRIVSSPDSNGFLDQWHYTLQQSLLRQLQHDHSWLTPLPLILLGLRTAYRADLQCSPSAKLYNKNLKLPNEFLDDSYEPEETDTFVQDIRDILYDIRPISLVTAESHTLFIQKKFDEATHMFVKDNTVNDPSLLQPYDGPFKVLGKIEHNSCMLFVDGKPSYFPVERLQPAFEEITDKFCSEHSEFRSDYN